MGCPVCTKNLIARIRGESPVPASSPVTVIREHMEELRRRAPTCAAAGNPEGEEFCWGRVAGLEFALRALGVET